MGRISVCLATYKGVKYLREQLESILLQLNEDDEVIISDDYSKDGTIELIKSFNDLRIKLIFNETGEHGVTSNFENALNHVNNEIIFLSDQDDIWREDKVECCLKWLEQYDLVVSDATLIDGVGNIIADSFFALRKPKKTVIGNFIKCGYLGCCMAFRREVLDKAQPFPESRKYCLHDNWLFLIGTSFFTCKIITKRLIFYRRHNNNLSNGGLQNSTSLLFKLQYRLYLLYHLLLRIFK